MMLACLRELLILMVCTWSVMASPLPGTEVVAGDATTPLPAIAGHASMINTGSEILKDITTRRLAATMGMPTNASFIKGEEPEIQEAISHMCELRDSHEALWDLPAEEVDVPVTFLRKMVVKLLQPTCKWIKTLFSNKKITNSLVCSLEEIDRVCWDYRTSRFSYQLVQATSQLDKDHMTKSEWVRNNVQTNSILPEVYEQITMTGN